MIWIFVYVGFCIFFLLGFIMGVKLHRSKYHGIITLTETDGKLLYSLELADDPELLANQDEAVFKIIPPEYVRVTSR